MSVRIDLLQRTSDPQFRDPLIASELTLKSVDDYFGFCQFVAQCADALRTLFPSRAHQPFHNATLH